jgi:hypothetical protein
MCVCVCVCEREREGYLKEVKCVTETLVWKYLCIIQDINSVTCITFFFIFSPLGTCVSSHWFCRIR